MASRRPTAGPRSTAPAGRSAAGTPDQLREGREALEAAWAEHGRSDSPRTSALTYFSLGPNARENAQTYIHSYYGAMGEDTAGAIVESVATEEDTVAGYAQAFEEAGADEIMFFPCSTDVEQVDLLAGALDDRL